jgi:hypothetical protein
MRHAAWQRLAWVYLERAGRPILLSLCTLLPLALLFASKHGFQPIALLQNLLLVSALFPFATGGVVLRSKADGSLAYIASLPISARDHARSWLAVVLCLSVPFAVTAALTAYVSPLAMRGLPLIVAGIALMALSMSVVLTMNAFQLSVPPAMAGAYFVSAMAALVLAFTGVARLWEITPDTLMPLVRSGQFLMVLSAAICVAAGVAFWWSWHRIGHFMTSYVGEAPNA